ncbi:MAG: integrase, partial [Acidobacteriota bacterium]|nr:integrase [Acidobacteriota bacterium]
LVARLLAAESQLAVLQQGIEEKKRPKPRFSSAFRLLWALFYRLWPDWREATYLMQPDTVVK